MQKFFDVIEDWFILLKTFTIQIKGVLTFSLLLFLPQRYQEMKLMFLSVQSI